MAPHGDVALEAQQEVLADRLDGLEHATVDRPRDTGQQPARIRRRGLDALADQHLEPGGSAMECVALRHRR